MYSLVRREVALCNSRTNLTGTTKRIERNLIMLSNQIELTQMVCGNCGCVFAIPESLRAEKEKAGGHWYCPNGHCRTYTETEIDRLRKRRYELSKEKEGLEKELRSANRKIKKLEKPAGTQ